MKLQAGYVLMQLLILPINLPFTALVSFGRAIYKHRSYHERLQALVEQEDVETESIEQIQRPIQVPPPNQKYWPNTKSNWLSFLYIFGEWADGVGHISQDVPLNRFINFIFFYALFLVLLILNVLYPFAIYADDDKYRAHCAIAHWLLFTFILSFLWVDSWIIYLVGKSAFSDFWTLFDLLFHCFLATSWVCNWILFCRQRENECKTKDTWTTFSGTMSSNNASLPFNEPEEERMCEEEEILKHISVLAFSLGIPGFYYLNII